MSGSVDDHSRSDTIAEGGDEIIFRNEAGDLPIWIAVRRELENVYW